MSSMCWVEMHGASSCARVDTLTLHCTQRRCQQSRPWSVRREIIDAALDGLVEKGHVDGGCKERLCSTGAFSYLRLVDQSHCDDQIVSCIVQEAGVDSFTGRGRKKTCSQSEWCWYQPAVLPNTNTPALRPQPSCRARPAGCIHLKASAFVQQARPSSTGRRTFISYLGNHFNRILFPLFLCVLNGQLKCIQVEVVKTTALVA